MNILVPITLYGWIFLTLFFFKNKDVHSAILLSLIGGMLFLPVYTYDIPLMEYSKITAISISIYISLLLTKNKFKSINYNHFDLFIVIWCILGPISTSLVNGLGFYDGFHQSISDIFTWGIFYWLGRKFFTTDASLKKFVYYILIGTLLYLPLCLIEIRLSPQLSKWIYGFYPHSFLQHIRKGGFRPMVFMQHGLMVSLWMAFGTIIAFSYWLSNTYKKIYGVKIQFLFFGLFGTTILTKSSGAAVLMIIGLAIVFLYQKKQKTWPLIVLILFIPTYLVFRMVNVNSSDEIITFISQYFNPERTQSLWFRLFQEDLYLIKMRGHELFGWGGWDRSAPVDPRTGRLLIVRDSMWLGIFSEHGFVGLISVYSLLLIGAWKLTAKKNLTKLPNEVFLLTLVMVIFSLDSLLNSMFNPVYIVVAGALATRYQNFVLEKKKNKRTDLYRESPIK